MLMQRARGFAARDCFPDVLRGMTEDPMVPVDAAFERVDEPAVERPKIVRRISETPATATKCDGNHGGPPCSDPECWSRPEAGETITLGPMKVHNVEQFMGGYAVTLADGQKFDVEADMDAVELEKFKGTDHALRFVCVKGEGGLLALKSFELAD